MSDNKLKGMEKIENAVVGTYQKIEDGVVNTYKAIETAVVDGYKEVEENFVGVAQNIGEQGGKKLAEMFGSDKPVSASGAYQKIEDAVVDTYQKIEDTVVGAYQKVEDKFVETFLDKKEQATEE